MVTIIAIDLLTLGDTHTSSFLVKTSPYSGEVVLMHNVENIFAATSHFVN